MKKKSVLVGIAIVSFTIVVCGIVKNNNRRYKDLEVDYFDVPALEIDSVIKSKNNNDYVVITSRDVAEIGGGRGYTNRVYSIVDEEYIVTFSLKGKTRQKFTSNSGNSIAYDNDIEEFLVYYYDMNDNKLDRTVNMLEFLEDKFPDVILAGGNVGFFEDEQNSYIKIAVSPKVNSIEDLEKFDKKPTFYVTINLKTGEAFTLDYNENELEYRLGNSFLTSTNFLEINNMEKISLWEYTESFKQEPIQYSLLYTAGRNLPENNSLLYGSFPTLANKADLQGKGVYIYIDTKSRDVLELLEYLKEDGQVLTREGVKTNYLKGS